VVHKGALSRPRCHIFLRASRDSRIFSRPSCVALFEYEGNITDIQSVEVEKVPPNSRNLSSVSSEIVSKSLEVKLLIFEPVN